MPTRRISLTPWPAAIRPGSGHDQGVRVSDDPSLSVNGLSDELRQAEGVLMVLAVTVRHRARHPLVDGLVHGRRILPPRIHLLLRRDEPPRRPEAGDAGLVADDDP